MSDNNRNSSTASSGLENKNLLTLDTTHAVAVASNHTIYSDDPTRVSVAYTYHWELTKKPPDNTSMQRLPTLGILVGYTILVMYVTWKIYGQQRKQSSCHTRQTHSSKYGAGITPTVQKDGMFVFGKPTDTGITHTVQKDGMFVFRNPTDTTAFEAPTSFSPLGLKSALDFRGSSMKVHQQRAQRTLNDSLFYDPKEFEGMTVGEVKTALAASWSNKWRYTNNDGSGITPAAHQVGMIVFGKPTGITSFEAPHSSSSPLRPIPSFKPAILFPMKPASIGTVSVTPAAETSDTLTVTSSKSSPASHVATMRPPANILIELLRNNRPDEYTNKEWNRFVTKHGNHLLNHLQNRPKRLYRAKILTPRERQLLLDADVPTPDLSAITQQMHRVGKMKATLKAGGRHCSTHHQSGFRVSASHQKLKSLTTRYHKFLPRPHRQKQTIHLDIINLPHYNWKIRKRDRTDSEAVTNGSNKRLRKPD